MIESALKTAAAPLPYAVLRETCGMRNSTLWASLAELLGEADVEQSEESHQWIGGAAATRAGQAEVSTGRNPKKLAAASPA